MAVTFDITDTPNLMVNEIYQYLLNEWGAPKVAEYTDEYLCATVNVLHHTHYRWEYIWMCNQQSSWGPRRVEITILDDADAILLKFKFNWLRQKAAI